MSRAARTYRGVAVESASPSRLLDEMFARIERECASACACMEAGDIAGRGRALGNGIELLDALSASLDRGAVPDLAPRLLALYGFARTRLVQAHLNADPRAVAEALRVVETLHGAFAEASSVA